MLVLRLGEICKNSESVTANDGFEKSSLPFVMLVSFELALETAHYSGNRLASYHVLLKSRRAGSEASPTVYDLDILLRKLRLFFLSRGLVSGL